MNINEMYVQCAQVMFFTYKYHGVSYNPSESGASAVTSAYKNAWMDDHGTNEYKIYLTRTSNDTTDTGNAGTFRAEDGWDIAEGVWEHVPTEGQITE